MKKRMKIAASALLLSGMVAGASAFALGETGGLTRGVNELSSQVTLLNIALASAMEQAETHVRLKGGSCVGNINFDAGTGERFSNLLDMGTGKTGVSADCVITLVTPADTSNKFILAPMVGQTLVATPYIDTKATSTAYTSTSNAHSIAKWKIAYSYATNSVNLKDIVVLGTNTNMFRAAGAPLATAV